MSDNDRKTQSQAPEDLTRTDQAKTRKPYDRPMLVKRDKLGQITAATSTSGISTDSSISSSRTLKTIEGQIDAANILAAVAALPVDAWRYKPETGLERQTHIGPYAEDFRAAFGVGDGVTISTIDAIGVCLAAIKALSNKVEVLEAELQPTRRKTAA